jgi:hypothetical protein
MVNSTIQNLTRCSFSDYYPDNFMKLNKAPHNTANMGKLFVTLFAW